MLTILYNRAGFEVVYPTRESWPNDLCDICVWPVTFMKNNKTGRRVMDDVSLPLDFGEDSFLLDADVSRFSLVGHEDACVTIEDIRETGKTIDVFHTTREHIGNLGEVVNRAKSLMPYAAWISSTISDYDHDPFSLAPRNVCRILPASYSSTKYTNSFDLLATGDLAGFLGVKSEPRNGFASFNHNYSARQPREFQIFNQVNSERVSIGLDPVPNFGGNTRGQGADVRHSGQGSGFLTLDPISAAQKNASLQAVVHLKSNDWGGGVPLLCLATGTPIIMMDYYAIKTKSDNYFRDSYNSCWVSDAASYSRALQSGSDFWEMQSENMRSTRNAIEFYTDDRWKKFLGEALG